MNIKHQMINDIGRELRRQLTHQLNTGWSKFEIELDQRVGNLTEYRLWGRLMLRLKDQRYE